jgi:hypothetical protein
MLSRVSVNYLESSATFEVKFSVILLILGVKVWWIMFIEKHSKDNSKKSTYFRHSFTDYQSALSANAR